LSLLGSLLVSNAASAWDIWTTIGVKEWFTTYSPGVLPPDSKAVSNLSLTVGGERLFVNFAGSSTTDYENPAYPVYPKAITHSQIALNLGYIATSEFAFTIGMKKQTTHYDVPGFIQVSDGVFSILGLVYTYSFADSPFSISGNIAYGKGTRKFDGGTSNNLTGSSGGDGTYLGYELSGNYAVTQSFSLNLGYRVEQFDDLIPVSKSGSVYTLSMEKIRVSGATVGLAYKF